MEHAIIKVSKLHKYFRLPNEKNNSIKGLLINRFRGGQGYTTQKVLHGIDFEIHKGEFFGIVGRNGSGKSTLLKLLSGIYTPTKGSISINGKLTPFIELGVGFNPELTGRENVFLNGALLGFSRKEMRGMYDDIVSFAELEKFMDQKLKNYSSGMQVRLAFSIAIKARNDILIFDEVLAVGDAAFQQKCLDVFERYKAEKQTIVLVTHDMETVRRFCTRAMLIHNGDIMTIGSPDKVANLYARLNRENSDDVNSETINKSNLRIQIRSALKDNIFRVGDTLTVGLHWPEIVKAQNVGVAIIKSTGEFIYGANTINKPLDLESRRVSYSVKLNVGAGKYHIMAGLFGKTSNDVLEFIDIGPQFQVEDDPKNSFRGLVKLKHEWHVE